MFYANNDEKHEEKIVLYSQSLEHVPLYTGHRVARKFEQKADDKGS